VAAILELFLHCDDYEGKDIYRAPLPGIDAVGNHAAEMKDASRAAQEQEGGQAQKRNDRASDKSRNQCPCDGRTICGDPLRLQPGHDRAGNEVNRKADDLVSRYWAPSLQHKRKTCKSADLQAVNKRTSITNIASAQPTEGGVCPASVGLLALLQSLPSRLGTDQELIGTFGACRAESPFPSRLAYSEIR
jgi:hypothetical protein